MAQYPGFIGGSYQSRSLSQSADRTYNLYAEQPESKSGKTAAALYGRPGMSTFCTLPTSPVRGLWAGDERLFAVSGSRLYEVFAGGTYNDRGDVGNDNQPAQMFPNGNQLLVISGGYAWLDTGTSISQALYEDSSPVAVRQGAFLDNYFIAAKPDSRLFNISSLLNGSTWDSRDVAVKEGYPDHIAAVLADHEDLWLGGEQTIEIWRDTGNADFPFERIPGAFLQLGVLAPWSLMRLFGAVAFLGGDPDGGIGAYVTRGYLPTRVSTHAVEAAWSSYSTVADAESFGLCCDAHNFWVTTFPTADATWVYDLKTGLWFEWGSGASGRWKARGHAYVFGKHLVGDYASGNLYEVSNALYDDSGSTIPFERTAPHLSDENQRMCYHEFRLDMEPATSLAITLASSNDGGKNFGAARAPDGAQIANGEPTRIVSQRWSRLGASRDRVFRVSGSAASRIALLAAYLQFSGGVS